MKTARSYFLTILTLMIFCTSNAQDWKLQKHHENIKVYFREKDNNTLEIRVKAEFNVNRDQFIKIIDNVDDYPKWIYRCSKAHNIKTKDGKQYTRTVTDVPWPLKDRDVVVKVNPIKTINNCIIMSSSACPNVIPKSNNIIRQEYSEIVWKIHKKGKNRTFVDYTLCIKAEEDIPAFIMKMVSTSGPFETFKNLDEFIMKKS